MTSRLMAADAASICATSAVLPMIFAASLSSRQVSSRRTIARTIDPSGTSVSSQMSLKGTPRAQWYTTCARFHTVCLSRRTHATMLEPWAGAVCQHRFSLQSHVVWLERSSFKNQQAVMNF